MEPELTTLYFREQSKLARRQLMEKATTKELYKLMSILFLYKSNDNIIRDDFNHGIHVLFRGPWEGDGTLTELETVWDSDDMKHALNWAKLQITTLEDVDHYTHKGMEALLARGVHYRKVYHSLGFHMYYRLTMIKLQDAKEVEQRRSATVEMAEFDEYNF